ncbi:MAG: hypothetical protein O2800_06100 [Planctomycetota bacterium]|nr:hypothetical protein [Planctomycetota bacterium]
MVPFRRLSKTLACIALLTTAACYSPKGGWFPGPSSAQTFYSTVSEPVTIRLVDTRTETAFFELAIPAEQQFTMKFVTGGGDDPTQTPDQMLWMIWPMGTKNGRLRNQLTVPPASCRRVDYFLRAAPEEIPADPNHRMRTDTAATREGGHTPSGGVVPSSSNPNIYEE